MPGHRLQARGIAREQKMIYAGTVSYTHLTLPTTSRV